MDVGNSELRRPGAWSATKTSVFLVWTAGCSFVTVGAATYLSWDQNVAIQVLAAAGALAVGLGAAFGIPFLVASARTPSTFERAPVDTEASEREQQPRRRSIDEQLTEQLALGNRLRTRFQETISDGTPNGAVQVIPEIDRWIDKTRAILDDTAPQLADYFATDTHETAEPNWPSKLTDAINLSHSGRLDRHVERLKKILE